MLLNFYFFQLLVLALVQCVQTIELCPVSSSPQYSKHGNFHYPLELFFPTLTNEPNVSCVHNMDLIRNNSCPLKSIGCPLIEENFRDAVSVSTWKKSTSLCTLKTILSDKNTNSRFIFLGGSVTAGVEGVGCCKKQDCFHEPCRRCSWVHQLEHWLHTSTRANVSVHNLGNPGTTSIFTGRLLSTIMMDNEMSNFTSSDVIIIDHSFNDNTLSLPIENIKLERGLEELIRGLLFMSKSLNDLPHIILFVADTRVLGKPEDRYTERYQYLAKHYGIHYYSFADAVLTNVSRTKQAAYHDYLTEVSRGDDHPPWYLHLAYADLFSGILLREMAECKSSSVAATVAPYVLPSPVTPMDGTKACKPSSTPLVKISHKDLISNTSIGSYRVSRPSTWDLRLDQKKRGGLMIELNNQSDYSIMHDAPIVFSLGVTLKQFRTMKTMLQLQYMRSYADAGSVTVSLCDLRIADLDALWDDYKHYRYTQQDALVEVLRPEWCRLSNESDLVTVSVYYKVQGDRRDTRRRLPPRGNQLFKINSVLVCQIET